MPPPSTRATNVSPEAGRKAILIDVGGVLVPSILPAAAADWGGRLGMPPAGLLDVADEIVLSCEVGYAKPDPRIYRTALGRLAAEPGAALFIDDTPGHVAAAEALGLTGHVHTSPASTMARITAFLR